MAEALIPANRLDELDPDAEFSRRLMGSQPEDKKAFIEHYLTVPTERADIVPMMLFPQQVRMLQDRTGRDVIVKGRQTRATSLLIADELRDMVNGNLWGATCVLGAQTDNDTAQIFRKRLQHHLYNDLHGRLGEFKVGVNVLDNPEELVLKDFNNRFLFTSGERRTMSRGTAVQRVHLSEFAFWNQTMVNDLMGGLFPAVPSAPYGNIVIESTPRGEQGAFYEMATGQQEDAYNRWVTHFYPWWLEPRYRVADDPHVYADILITPLEMKQLKASFEPNDHEEKLMNEFGLTVEQILWRRFRKVEQDRTPAPFLQEFVESPDTCWLGTEGKFFDTPDGVDHLEYYRSARRQPVKLLEKLPYKGDDVSFYGPNLAVWEYPDQNDTYVSGFDAAGGGLSKDSDWSVFYVMSVRKEKVVARLRVQASPKVFAAMVAAVATYFKHALVNGERSHHGSGVFEELIDLGYKNIYYHTDPFKPTPRGQTPKPGVYPTPEHRQQVLERFKTGITNHAIDVFCSELVREMQTFTWQKVQFRLKAQAEGKNMHDDCLFAAAYAWFIVDKARNRLRRYDDQPEEIIVGRNGLVQRTGRDMSPERAFLGV